MLEKKVSPFILQRADPYIYKDENRYYFTASVPAYDRIILRCAKTIAGLKEAEEKTLWVKHESGPQSIHIWAPELHKIGDNWYIYYAAGDKDDVWEIRPYVLKCLGSDPMKDDWVEMGMLQAAAGDEFSFKAFSLDATVFAYQKEHYIVWAEKTGVGKKISNLYIARLVAPNILATPQVLITTPDYEWERVGFWVNEGAAVLEHKDRLYLTFSASETGISYCMGLLTLEENGDVLDPNAWIKTREPVLVTDEAIGLYGPGHNSFVKAEDGETDLCIYHVRQETQIEGDPLYNPNRHAMMMKVVYDEEDRPVFSFENNLEI